MAELHKHDIPEISSEISWQSSEISRQLKRIADLLEKSLNQDAERKLPNIEEVIKIVSSIQEVKDYYIGMFGYSKTSQLLILFKEEIMLFNIDIIKYHLQQVEEFKDKLDIHSIKNEYNQITIDLK